MQIRCSLKRTITKSRKSLKAPNSKHPFRRNTSVMVAKLTRLIQKTAILWRLVAASYTSCRAESFEYYGKWSLFVLRSIQHTHTHVPHLHTSNLSAIVTVIVSPDIGGGCGRSAFPLRDVKLGPGLAADRSTDICALCYAAWDVTDVRSFSKHTSDGAPIVASVFWK